jgi:NAD+ diphosphatase
MLLAVFPDEKSVLLIRHGDTSDEAHRHGRFHIPTVDELKKVGLALPTDLWELALRGEETVGGLFMEMSRLEHVLARARMEGAGISFEIVGRRQAADILDIDDYWAMNRAFHLANWDRTTRFCGACATPMERSDRELSKFCPSCGGHSYPQIAPAVIMAVVREGKLLMAHSHRHPGNLYSVLAGFVEAGETLEHAVSREVHEESGLLVRNIQYFSSQPWPFPNSLMIAFTAEYAGGDLKAEEEEIDDIGWFGPDEIPEEIPSTYSVARRLIEWFVSTYGTEDDLRRLLVTD